MDKTILDNKEHKFQQASKPIKKEKCPCTYEDILKKAKELNITFNQAAKLCK